MTLLPRFDAALSLFAVLAFALVAVTFPSHHLLIQPRQVAQLAVVLGILGAVVAFYKHRGEARLASLVHVLFWALLLNTLCSLLFYLPVRVGAPVSDPLFTRLDATLGFATSSLVAWSRARPRVDSLLFHVYDSLPVLCLASVALPSLVGRPERTRIMLLAVVVSVLVSVALSFPLSGVGPWETERFTPTPFEAHTGALVHSLKSGRPYAIDLQYCDPIVTLPSWHTIFALLSAFVWRPVRRAWPLALAWALLIALSTLTTGWHYLVDVLAGAALATGAQAVAAHLLTRLDPASPPATTLAPAFLDE